MAKTIKMATLAALLIMSSVQCYAEKGVENLSPELRELLKQEMMAIEKGMKKIIPAYISGDLGKIEKIAHKIEGSYILKQKITKEQKKELRKKLPKEFIAKDKQFHKYAGMLAHVSKEKHMELVGFYYAKMLESCVGCHSKYATHKFPDLAHKEADTHHH